MNIKRVADHWARELPPDARIILLASAAVGVLLPWLFAIPERGAPAGVVLFLFLLSGLIYLGYRRDTYDRCFRLVLLLPLAFGVRSAVAMFSSYIPVAPLLYTLDAEGYDRLGLIIAQAWAVGAVPDPALFTSFNVKAYASLCAAVYTVLGHSLLSMKILNCFAGALVIYNVFRIARTLLGERHAVSVALLLSLFPSLVFWSSQNFRDALIFYGISEMIYASLRWSETGSLRWFLRLVLAIALTGLLRNGVAAIAALVLLLIALRRIGHRLPPLLRPVGYLALGLTVGAGIYLLMNMSFFPHIMTPGELSILRGRLAAHGTTNFPTVRYESWLDVVISAPYVTAYYLLAPFPWHLANPMQALASVENLFFVVSLGLAVLGTRRLWPAHRYRLSFMLLFIGGLTLAAGIIEGNIGTGYRHKMHIIPYVTILACAGLNKPSALSDQLSAKID